jgi:hypothetical protein
MVRFLTFPVVTVVLALSLGSGRASAGVIHGYNCNHLDGWTVFGNVVVGDRTAWLQTRSGLNATKLAAGLGVDIGDLSINHGSAVTRALTLGDGDSLSFDWQFLTDELSGHGGSRDDIAFWGLFNLADEPSSYELSTLTSAFQADLVSSSQGLASETGFTAVTPSVSAGDYLLVFGVANVGNNAKHSALAIQNLLITSGPIAPEPLPLGLPLTVSIASDNLALADPLVQQTIVNPEPASFAVWALGLAGVAFGAARRRRAAPLQPTAA